MGATVDEALGAARVELQREKEARHGGRRQQGTQKESGLTLKKMHEKT